MTAFHLFVSRLMMALAALAMIAAPALPADDATAHGAPMNSEEMAADHCAGMPAMKGERHHEAPPDDCIAGCLAVPAAMVFENGALDDVPPAFRRGMEFLKPDRLVGHPPGLDPPPPRLA